MEWKEGKPAKICNIRAKTANLCVTKARTLKKRKLSWNSQNYIPTSRVRTEKLDENGEKIAKLRKDVKQDKIT